jgi:hypothetical protein
MPLTYRIFGQMSYQELRKRFQAASQAVLQACDALDSSNSLKSGAHLVPPDVIDRLDELAVLSLEIGTVHPLPLTAGQIRIIEKVTSRPVFLGGLHKSGTTLLRNLLDGHEALCVLPFDGGIGPDFLHATASLPPGEREAAVLSRSLRRLVELGGHLPSSFRRFFSDDSTGTSPIERFARSCVPLAGHFGASARGILQAIAGAFLCASEDGPDDTAKYWVYKSTLNVPDAAGLSSIFPEALFIEILRHPCAVYASQKKKMGLKKRPFRPYYELECLYTWGTAHTLNMRDLGPEKYHVLRYEDLVSDCDGVMRSAAAFLGIRHGMELCRPSMGGLPVRANTAYTELHDRAGRVMNSSLEKWREHLDPAEIALVESFVLPAAEAGGAFSAIADIGGTLSRVLAAKKSYRRREGVMNISARETAAIVRMRRKMRAVKSRGKEVAP